MTIFDNNEDDYQDNANAEPEGITLDEVPSWVQVDGGEDLPVLMSFDSQGTITESSHDLRTLIAGSMSQGYYVIDLLKAQWFLHSAH